MKTYRLLITILLVIGLSACSGSNNEKNTNNKNAVNENTVNEVSESQIEITEISAETSPETQAEEPLPDNCDNEFYPVISGASWNYTMESSVSGTDSFTRSIPDVSNNGFTDQDAWEIGTTRTGTWSCDNGNLTALSLGGLATVSTSEQTFVATSQESSGVTYPSPLNVGTNWNQTLSISGDMAVAEGMNGTADVSASQTCTAIGEESVTVSAGTFDAMKLNCSTSISVTVDIDGMTTEPMTIDSLSEIWLVRGVGMVKMTDNNAMANSTIELTAYALP